MTILFLAAAALAQPTAPAANPHAGHAGHAAPATPATPAAAPAWSVETTTVARLLANPGAKAVLDRHLPGFSAHPMIGQAGPMTLRQIQGFTQGQITDAHLTAIQTDLAALPAS
jgi:hypothetical protein